ncbi:MAG: hypothetical protein ACI8RD_008467 [Bacillariaceae sp.]|jgi:hypothetical protein
MKKRKEKMNNSTPQKMPSRRNTMASLLILQIICLLIVSCNCTSQQHVEENNNGKNKNNNDDDKKNPSPIVNGIPVLDKSQFAPFDTDILPNCRDLLEHCQSHIYGHVYLQCPGLCTKLLEEEGMIGTADDNPDALYEVGTLRTYQGSRIDSDRFEGYVLVLAVVPLLPGMAVYYNEMMEYLHGIFKPKAEFVIQPIDHYHGIHIKEKVNGKVVILEEKSAVTIVENDLWMKHLTSIKPRSGLGTKEGDGVTIEQRPLQTDRVTIYIVSADGYYIEQLIVPTMSTLKEKIRLYTKTMDYEL